MTRTVFKCDAVVTGVGQNGAVKIRSVSPQ